MSPVHLTCNKVKETESKDLAGGNGASNSAYQGNSVCHKWRPWRRDAYRYYCEAFRNNGCSSGDVVRHKFAAPNQKDTIHVSQHVGEYGIDGVS